MKLFLPILLIIIQVSLSTDLVAQKKSKWSKSIDIQMSIDEKLNKADQEKQTNPSSSIDLINEIIQEAKESKNKPILLKSYTILGEIFEDTDQFDLAIQRYQIALGYAIDINDVLQIQSLHLNIGNNYKLLNEYDASFQNYKLCLDKNINSDISLKCREAITDLEVLLGSDDNSIEKYSDLESEYGKESDISNSSRLQAKKAKTYANTSNVDLARENYESSKTSYDKSSSADDYQELEEAKEAIISQSPEEELVIREDFIDFQTKNNVDIEEIIEEKIMVADALIEDGEMDAAADYINETKDIVKDNIGEKTIPIFKKSAELNTLQGNYQAALEDLLTYETNFKTISTQKEQELDELIQVLRKQGEIDIQSKDYDIQTKEKEYTRNQVKNQNIIISLLSLVLLGSLIMFFVIYRNVMAKRKSNEKLLLKSLRSQMNPHFIFNVLNSVNNFISKNDERSANKYLSSFSKLMRKVLDDSQKDFISLSEEYQMLELYLGLEQSRFQDKFDYQVIKDEQIDEQQVYVAPMLIQPLLENAIWHGMRYKENKGFIKLEFSKKDHQIIINITDNGIGRDRSKELKTKNQQTYKSTGLKNIHDRIDLINRLYKLNYSIEFKDAFPDAQDKGTSVNLIIPIT